MINTTSALKHACAVFTGDLLTLTCLCECGERDSSTALMKLLCIYFLEFYTTQAGR